MFTYSSPTLPRTLLEQNVRFPGLRADGHYLFCNFSHLSSGFGSSSVFLVSPFFT